MPVAALGPAGDRTSRRPSPLAGSGRCLPEGADPSGGRDGWRRSPTPPGRDAAPPGGRGIPPVRDPAARARPVRPGWTAQTPLSRYSPQ